MRPIKFRAWDEEAEYMFYSDSDKDKDSYFFAFDEKGCLRGYAIRPPRASSDPMEPPEPYADDYPVIQFTGLKDWWKDDILKSPDGRLGIIEYKEHIAKYVLEAADFIMGYCDLGTIDRAGWIKVGNVHSNPELLGEQK